MDELQKSRIRLDHWIGHNHDHVKGYAEVASNLQSCGYGGAAALIREAIRLVQEADERFREALMLIPVETHESNAECPGHPCLHHQHDHEHCHDHDHNHNHEHCHDHHSHSDLPCERPGEAEHCCSNPKQTS
jgi:hypothetical protein